MFFQNFTSSFAPIDLASDSWRVCGLVLAYLAPPLLASRSAACNMLIAIGKSRSRCFLLNRVCKCASYDHARLEINAQVVAPSYSLFLTCGENEQLKITLIYTELYMRIERVT